MTIDRAKTIEMATEAGGYVAWADGDLIMSPDNLERFAALVRAQVLLEVQQPVHVHSTARAGEASTTPAPEGDPRPWDSVPGRCWCRTCRPPITPQDMRMVLCPDCGNKRCPKANHHDNACTNSNEPGQPGSAYPAVDWAALSRRSVAGAQKPNEHESGASAAVHRVKEQ